jgi:hypothetical protein
MSDNSNNLSNSKINNESDNGSDSESITNSDSLKEIQNNATINSAHNSNSEYDFPEDIIDTTRKAKPNPTNFKQLIGSYVKLLQMKMSTDDMKLKKKFHPDEYETDLANFVPAFKEEYPHLYKMIISGTDLSILEMFLDNISDIDSGKKSLNDVRNDLGHILHNKYVKTKLG